MDLSKYTLDGKEPVARTRLWKRDGKIYQTFAYPLNGGVQIAVLKHLKRGDHEWDAWEDFAWYPSFCDYCDNWSVL